MYDTQLYAQILGITAPWSVQSVDLRLKDQQVNILLAFDQEYRCKCPVCSKESPRYDKVRRKCRKETTHLLWRFTYIGVAKREWQKLAQSLEQYLWMILNAIRLDVNSGCA